MAFVLALLLQVSAATNLARPAIGMAAAAGIMLLAAYAGWQVTDRLMARRQRADEE